MQPALVSGGLVLFIVAGAVAAAPQFFARNWVRGEEWRADPETAARKQRNYAYVSATVMGLFGLLFVVTGVFI